MSATLAEKLRTMAASRRRRAALSSQEVAEVIRAIRRGVRVGDVAETLGCARNNIYSAIGSWAVRHMALPDDSEAGR